MSDAEPQASTPLLSQSGFIATICLNRPRHHNRIEPADLDALATMFSSIDADADTRVLILTATGKSFSSGYHLGEMQDKPTPETVDDTPSLFSQVADQLENLRVPTICALNGSVYGGSTDLALACDFRIGVEGSRMFMPAARLGLQYYAGGLRRYVQRLGLGPAKKLFLTAAPIDAEEMLRIGYLDELLTLEQLMPRVEQLAHTLAINAPIAVVNTKRFLNQIARGEVDVSAINRGHNASVQTEDAREGVAAWHEKREPIFRGR